MEFVCREPVYCAKFPPAELAALRQGFARQMIQAMKQRFSCFDFVESGGGDGV